MSTNIEYEAKILNVSSSKIKKKLKDLGATKVGDYNFRRYVFDTIPQTAAKWVRLRSNGSTTTLAVKEIMSNDIDGTKEWEVVVSDIDTTLVILEKIGITHRSYQENLRTEYLLDGVEVSIDSWPDLNPYLEIEGKNVKEVLDIAAKLGYSEADLTSANTEELYKSIGIDVKTVKKLAFKEQ